MKRLNSRGVVVGRRNRAASMAAVVEAVEARMLMSASGHQVDEDPLPAFFPTDAYLQQQIASLASLPTDMAAGTDVTTLHSRPGASKKIFLNFYGDTVPSWSSYTPGKILPYSIDVDRTTINTTEANAIAQIWQRVAEMYSPFNIDVTTEDPGTYPVGQVAKVQFCATQDWYSGGGVVAGGVARLFGFSTASTAASNNAWVFLDGLGGAGSVKPIADAAAHEVGHLMGLQHHGLYKAADDSVVQQYDDHNSLFAPIMGDSYSSLMPLWYNDRSVASPSIQDDLAVIASVQNGFGYSSDSFGSSVGTAGSITYNNANLTDVSASGVLSVLNDEAWISFSSGEGPVTFDVKSDQYGMLDAQVELLDSNGTVLSSSTRSPAVGARFIPTDTVSAYLPAGGTYYLRIYQAAVQTQLNNVLVGTETVGSQTGETPGAFAYNVGQFYVTGTLTSTLPLVANAGGPYTVSEGGVTFVTAAASTGPIEFYEWDLDNDGVYETSSMTVIFDAAAIDGAVGVTRTIGLRLTDYGGNVETATATVSIANVAPLVTDAVVSGAAEATAGATISVVATDVAAADIPGLSYDFDFNNDGVIDLANSASATVAIPISFFDDATAAGFSGTIRVVVKDDDGGATTFLTPLTFANVAPSGVIVLSSSTVAEGGQITMGLTGLKDGVTDLASGILVEFDFDGNGTYDFLTYSTGVVTPVLIPENLINGTRDRTVGIRLTDKDGGTSKYGAGFRVTNVAPSASILTSSLTNNQMVMATQVTIGSAASDPSSVDAAALSYKWALKYAGNTVGSGNGASFSFVPQTVGTYTLVLTVTDPEGGSVTTTQDVTSYIPAPTVTGVTGGTNLSEGQNAVFVVNLSAPAQSPLTITYTPTYSGGASGSGTPVTVTLPAGRQSLEIVVPTTNNGTADAAPVVGITITSVTGATLGSAQTASFTLVSDDVGVSMPVDGSNAGTVQVTGSALNDVVRIRAGAKKNTIEVQTNDKVTTYFNAKRIVVDLGDGDDQLSIDAKLKIPTLIFGGAGKDTIVGGSGRDILIGGDGADSLFGGKGDNLLIADIVNFGIGSGEAESLFATWNDKGSASSRFAVVQTGVLSGSAVTDDGDADRVDVLGKSDFRLFSNGDQVFARSGAAARRA